MTLQAWIKETGPKNVSRLLGVDPSTVSDWRHFRTVPRAPLMVKINRITAGQVSYKEIIETYCRKNKRNT